MVGLDGRHWAGWADLLVPPGVRRGARVAVVFIDRARDGRGEVIRAAITASGDAGPIALAPADVPFSGTSPAQTAALVRALSADALVLLDRDALPLLHADIESALRLDDDYVAQ